MSGTNQMVAVINAAKKRMPALKRIAFYKPVIKAFWEDDWDGVYEVIGIDPAFDTALNQLDSSYFEDDNG